MDPNRHDYSLYFLLLTKVAWTVHDMNFSGGEGDQCGLIGYCCCIQQPSAPL